MKRMLLYILVSTGIAAALSLWTSITVSKEVLSTLYTVAGVIFSVGMSITIAPKTDNVSNVTIKKSIRKSYLNVRNSFMYFFGANTIIFILSGDIAIKGIPASFFEILCAVYLLISIIYYIYNFIKLQELGEQIEDQVMKERNNQ